MIATQVRGRIARGWATASSLGVSPLGGSRNRTIVAANQFSVLASLSTAGFAVLFAVYSTPDLLLPCAGMIGLIAAWAMVLYFNHLGWHLAASILSIAAPIAQFTYLAQFFGAGAGFHLYLLGGGALAFALFRTEQWLARGVLIAACGAAVLAGELRWHEGAADWVSPAFVRGVFVANVALVVLLFYVLARFNHRYYLRERSRNAQLLESAQVAAQTDALTDVYNRRGIAPILSSVARRSDYSLALVDLDRFKRINDRLGHGAGDVVLANAARTLVKSVGDAGTVARWGGEEFLVVLPGLTLVESDALMERVRQDIEDEYGAEESLARVTISVGLAHAPRYASKEEVLRLADANLYEAKSAGRNVVISARIDAEAE